MLRVADAGVTAYDRPIAAERNELPARWPEVFSLMWEAYLAETIAVGAVIVDAAGEVLSRGRNRTFDEPRDVITVHRWDNGLNKD